MALVTAKGGANVGTTSPFVLPMVGTMTIITTFLSPYVIRAGWRYADLLIRPKRPPRDDAEARDRIKSGGPAEPMEAPAQDSSPSQVHDPGEADKPVETAGEPE